MSVIFSKVGLPIWVILMVGVAYVLKVLVKYVMIKILVLVLDVLKINYSC